MSLDHAHWDCWKLRIVRAGRRTAFYLRTKRGPALMVDLLPCLGKYPSVFLGVNFEPSDDEGERSLMVGLLAFQVMVTWGPRRSTRLKDWRYRRIVRRSDRGLP